MAQNKLLFAVPVEQNPMTPVVPSATPIAGSPGFLPGFPASKMFTPDPRDVALLSSLDATFVVDYGRLRSIDCLAVMGLNTSPSSQYSLSHSTDGVNYTLIRNSAFVWPNITATPIKVSNSTDANDPRVRVGETVTLFTSFPRIQARYLKFSLADPDYGPTFQASIGRFFAGTAFVPPTSYQYGSSIEFRDSSTRERTSGGTVAGMEGSRFLAASIQLNFLSAKDLDDFMWDFNYWRATNGEVIACLNVNDTPNLQRNTLYGNLVDGKRISYDSFDNHSQTLVVETY